MDVQRRPNTITWPAILLTLSAGFAALLFFYGYEKTWRLWNVPVLMPPFADMRVITAGAESQALGYDPLVANPRDPWQRPMNYPRIWHTLFWLGINQSHTVTLAITFIALFVVGLLLLAPRADRATALLLAAGVFSPAVLLAVERANNDLFVFFLLATAVALFRASWVKSSVAVTNLAIVLKLFPAFGLLYLLQIGTRSALRLIGVSIGVLLVYVAWTYRDLILVSRVTTDTPAFSYGAGVLGAQLQAFPRWAPLGRHITVVAHVAALIVLALSFLLRGRDVPHADASRGPDMAAFRMGSGIYIGTFLLWNNWEYRLVFLLLAVPQLVEWARSRPVIPTAQAPRESPAIRNISRAALCALLISQWHSLVLGVVGRSALGWNLGFLLDEAGNWTVFATLTYLLLQSCPVARQKEMMPS